MPARNSQQISTVELASIVANAAANPVAFAESLKTYDERKSAAYEAEDRAKLAKSEAERSVAKMEEERARLDAGWEALRTEQAEALEIAKELEAREKAVTPREQACADRDVALQEREAALVQAKAEAVEAFKRLVGAG